MVNSTAVLAEVLFPAHTSNSSQSPVAHQTIQNHLLLQFLGTGCPPLISAGTCTHVYTDIHTGTHILKTQIQNL